MRKSKKSQATVQPGSQLASMVASALEVPPNPQSSSVNPQSNVSLNPQSAIANPQSDELARCAGDIVYWVNTYGWTYDPRVVPTVLPFKLFARQAEFLAWLAQRE